MNRCFLFVLCTISLFYLPLYFFTLPTHSTEPQEYLSTETVTTHRILLIPLDSRPQCLDFVIDLAKIADLEIIAPPRELLGDDRDFARSYKLRRWLSEHIASADAAILSADMLIHGGLLPSRLNSGSSADVEETIQLLRQIRKQKPTFPIYVFNIVPRITVADQPEAEPYKDDLLAYSALTEKIYTFGQAADIKERHYLEQKLPAALRIKYHKLYEDNAVLNERLLKLTDEGVITKLIVGQDDGELFGLPNVTRESFQRKAASLGLTYDRAALTRGADEVAQTLLCSAYQYFHGFTAPSVYVIYNSPASAEKIMPYMPNPVKESIREKIFLSGAVLADSPETADFILYVNIGSKQTAEQRSDNAQFIEQRLWAQRPIALIDLSEDFSAADTLLPVLLAHNAPVNRLIAYAGWNTTSNSAGTALAQAILFNERKANVASLHSLLRLYQHNLAFLNARFLEDYFYLKSDIDHLNVFLTEQSLNIYHLDNAMDLANTHLNELFTAAVHRLTQNRGWQTGLTVQTDNGSISLLPKALQATAVLPWHRTFEIDVDLKIFLHKQQEIFSK